MAMYNLLESSKNYRKTTGSLRNYYKDEPSNPPTADYNAVPITNSRSFKSVLQEKHQMQIKKMVKTLSRIIQRLKKLEIVAPLKHVSNFWRTSDMPLLNCEVFLTLTWSQNCVLTDITTQTARTAQQDNPARPAINAPTNATFQITDTKLYVPVATLSTQNDKKLLEQLKTGFKRTIKWNKYRSEMTNQTKNNNLNCLTDPTFTKVSRLFVLSFENQSNRTSFSNNYVPNVQIKYFNVLINGKTFLSMPTKNGE